MLRALVEWLNDLRKRIQDDLKILACSHQPSLKVYWLQADNTVSVDPLNVVWCHYLYTSVPIAGSPSVWPIPLTAFPDLLQHALWRSCLSLQQWSQFLTCLVSSPLLDFRHHEDRDHFSLINCPVLCMYHWAAWGCFWAYGKMLEVGPANASRMKCCKHFRRRRRSLSPPPPSDRCLEPSLAGPNRKSTSPRRMQSPSSQQQLKDQPSAHLQLLGIPVPLCTFLT